MDGFGGAGGGGGEISLQLVRRWPVRKYCIACRPCIGWCVHGCVAACKHTSCECMCRTRLRPGAQLNELFLGGGESWMICLRQGMCSCVMHHGDRCRVFCAVGGMVGGGGAALCAGA